MSDSEIEIDQDLNYDSEDYIDEVYQEDYIDDASRDNQIDDTDYDNILLPVLKLILITHILSYD